MINIYPKFSAQPIKEEELLNGYLESSNDGMIAKISGIKLVKLSSNMNLMQ